MHTHKGGWTLGKSFQGKHLIPALYPKLLFPSTCGVWDRRRDDVVLPTLRSSILRQHSGSFTCAVTSSARSDHIRSDGANFSTGIKGGKYPKVSISCSSYLSPGSLVALSHHPTSPISRGPLRRQRRALEHLVGLQGTGPGRERRVWLLGFAASGPRFVERLVQAGEGV